MIYPIGIDASAYNKFTPQELAVYGTSADFFINRLGIVFYRAGWTLDSTVFPRFEILREVAPEMPLGVYFLPHSSCLRNLSESERTDFNKHPYVRTVFDALNKLQPEFFAIDVEDHTAMNSSKEGVLLAFLDLLEWLTVGMEKEMIPRMPIGVYSRASWVKQFSSLSKAIENNPSLFIWTANWVFGQSIQYPTIRDLRKIQPRHRPITFSHTPARQKSVTFHQFSGDSGKKISFADFNAGRPVDLNVYIGTKEEFLGDFSRVSPLATLDSLIQRLLEENYTDKEAIWGEYQAIRRKLHA